jgi:hypothetical protein
MLVHGRRHSRENESGINHQDAITYNTTCKQVISTLSQTDPPKNSHGKKKSKPSVEKVNTIILYLFARLLAAACTHQRRILRAQIIGGGRGQSPALRVDRLGALCEREKRADPTDDKRADDQMTDDQRRDDQKRDDQRQDDQRQRYRKITAAEKAEVCVGNTVLFSRCLQEQKLFALACCVQENRMFVCEI